MTPAQEMRSMSLTVAGRIVYSSKFDPRTGSLVRVLDTPTPRREDYDGSHGNAIFTYAERKKDHLKAYLERYPRREEVFSPVPETIDVSITDRCGFGCTYCYMDSRPKHAHAPKDLLEKILLGFDQPPYQVAIGGGEPTEHPDLPWILRRSREIGTVPNYTTNGETLRDDVVEATNEVCGGVAMTYHSFKGLDWFAEHYLALKERLKVQVNIHLIASNGVAENLDALVALQPRLGPLRIVLLAYYPEVGRGTMDGLLRKRVYMTRLPAAIRRALEQKTTIAYSEGLLPFVLSRPELGLETRFAMFSEGRFSAYFDTLGRMSHSSFVPPRDGYCEVHDDCKLAYGDTATSPRALLSAACFRQSTKSQWLWDNAPDPRNLLGAGLVGDACQQCQHAARCVTPTDVHYYACAFAENNSSAVKAPDEPHYDPWTSRPWWWNT
jgi:MoaA/NifB/PqqE/SkfB family radical SAM enzyme